MVQQWKKDKVEEIKQHLQSASVVALVDMKGLPAKQLQGIKQEISSIVNLKMTKKSAILRALQGSRYESLREKLGDMPALMFTKTNPFKLYKTLKKSRVTAFAKAGDTLPVDVTIPEGPTDFTPGPMIGEFGKFKVKTRVEGGKIAVIKDTVVAKAGDAVTAELASFLKKMGVKPMKVGLNMTHAMEGTTVYDKTVLDIDEESYLQNVMLAAQHAQNLAVEAGILTKETIEFVIVKAVQNARGLALEASILSKDMIDEHIAKAQNQALALKNETGV